MGGLGKIVVFMLATSTLSSPVLEWKETQRARDKQGKKELVECSATSTLLNRKKREMIVMLVDVLSTQRMARPYVILRLRHVVDAGL